MRRRRRRKSLLQEAWLRWRDDVTPAAKYLLAGVVLAVFGTVSVTIPVYQIFCGLVALLATAEVAGVLMRPRVDITGGMPQRTSVGQPATGEFCVTNRSRWPAFDLELSLQGLPPELVQPNAEQIVPYLGGGETVTMPVTVVPLRRGLYQLPDLRASSTFPFNLARSGSSRVPIKPLLVLPTFHPIAAVDVPFGTRYQPGGIALTSNIGESPEYIGNREYVPGEPARRLDFRSWARLAKPVVRVYHEEYYCRIALILDTFVPPRRTVSTDGFPDLEAAVSLTASVADVLSGGEHIIDLFAAGTELYVFRTGRHTTHFDSVLEILACVEACRINPFASVVSSIADELTSISTAVCIFLDWDTSRQRLVQAIAEAGCRPKILIVRDGDTTVPIDAPDVAEVTQYTVRQIRDGGLEVV